MLVLLPSTTCFIYIFKKMIVGKAQNLKSDKLGSNPGFATLLCDDGQVMKLIGPPCPYCFQQK